VRDGCKASVFGDQHFRDLKLARLDDVDTICGVTLLVDNLVFDHWNFPKLIGQLADRGLCQLGKERDTAEEMYLLIELLLLYLTKN
jgi:hypothetical protein